MSGERSSDPAAEAFDQLRLEVVLLRRAVEGLAAIQPEPAVDYGPILSQLKQQMIKMGEGLSAVAESPYLSFSHEEVAEQIRTISQRTQRDASVELRQAKESLSRATADVIAAAGQVRTREGQRRWLVYAAGAGAALALSVWLVLSGPVARALPSSWQASERMAAATLGESRWNAGARMMRRADPEAWREILQGEDLVRRNGARVQGCLQRAMKLGRQVGCEVRIDPPEG